MSTTEERLSAWASIIGTLIALLGLVRSKFWIAGISALAVAASISFGVYARRERLRLKNAIVRIEGRSIDSLSLANLNRGINHSLFLQSVKRIVTIEERDLKIVSTYEGYCRVNRETSIGFSLDSDHHIPFNQFQCVAYDLIHDILKTRPIQPILMDSDGNSKKITVPFHSPLRAQQPFRVRLETTLPGCLSAGVEYFSTSLSFDQQIVPKSAVRLIFRDHDPEWVRVYEVGLSNKPVLLRDLPVSVDESRDRLYYDEARHLAGRSARVYLFERKFAATYIDSIAA